MSFRNVYDLPDLEMRVAIVLHVTSHTCDLHGVSRLQLIYELGEETTLWMLEVPQVHLDQQVNVA